MAPTRPLPGTMVAIVLAVLATSTLRAQDPASAEARVKTFFRAFDMNEDGWLSGREVVACDCLKYDADRNGEITWDEFRTGWARAPLFGGRAAPRDDDARPAPQPRADGRFRPGDRVQVSVGGTWYAATVVSAQNGQYRLSRDDRTYGVTTDETWVSDERLRPYVDRPTPARPPTTTLPSSIPVGAYGCMTYGAAAQIGTLRIVGAGVSSGVTPDGSGPQHRFAYDPASGAIEWAGGLQIAGVSVERAEYRPETDGTPNINLHYRRSAGGYLNSMSCRRR